MSIHMTFPPFSPEVSIRGETVKEKQGNNKPARFSRGRLASALVHSFLGGGWIFVAALFTAIYLHLKSLLSLHMMRILIITVSVVILIGIAITLRIIRQMKR